MKISSAPGKVILFGEHAVVYNKLGIAASVDKRCFVTVSLNIENTVAIDNRGFNMKKSLTEDELFKLFDEIEELKKKKDFDRIKELGKENKLIAPFFVIAHLMKKHGFKPVKIIIEMDVPKNLGSSSSIFSALALALSKFLKKDLSKKEVSDLAYEGDVIAHGGTPSGIDNSTVTYGKYLLYRQSDGVKPMDINFQLPLIFVESGEPANTGETVPYVREQRKENQEFVDRILGRLDSITAQALEAFKYENLELIGELMTEYYLELKKLNISTENLDKIIEIAIKNKALGAKPTGGWGGGCCIVLAKDDKQAENLIKIYNENGFNSFKTKIGVEGVKLL